MRTLHLLSITLFIFCLNINAWAEGELKHFDVIVETYQENFKENNSDFYKDIDTSQLSLSLKNEFETFVALIDDKPEKLGVEKSKTLFSVYFDYILDTEDKSALIYLRPHFRYLSKMDMLEERSIRSYQNLLLSFGLIDEAKQISVDSGLPYLLDDESFLAEISNTEKSEYSDDSTEKYKILSATSDIRALDQDSFEMSSFSGVVVVTHPQCLFTKMFLEDVKEDAGLYSDFKTQSLFLVSPWQMMPGNKLYNYQTDYPDIRMAYATDTSEWDEIDYWGSPTFYFVKEGQRVKKIVGWPKREREQRLLDMKDAFKLIEE